MTYSAYLGTATDADFYKYTASGNGIEQITMSVPSNKNYDVYVYDASFNLVAAGIRGTGLSEEVVYKVTSGAIYSIKVSGINGDSEHNLTLLK